MDLQKVYAEKAVDLNIMRLISDENNVNEWVSLDPFESLKIKNLSRLYVKSIDMEKLKDINNDTEVAVDNMSSTNDEKIGRREFQHEIISAIIVALNYPPLSIPDGGKAKIKNICLTRPRIFTPSSFDHAWKDGLANKFYRMANHSKFTRN